MSDFNVSLQLFAGAKSDVQKLTILCIVLSIESFRYIAAIDTAARRICETNP